jgi:RNA polymerase sigma-70 factor (ECF subfamily)
LDRESVAAAREGDRQAFEGLVSRHRATAYRLALHFLHDPDEADEAAQEAFVRAYQLLTRFDATREFGPWLRGIVAKVCAESRRRRSRMAEADPETLERAPGAGFDTSGTTQDVQDALKALPDKYRIPLVMFYVDEASVIDVAYALSLSPGAVRVRLHRGREMLRKKLSFMAEKEVARDGLQEGTAAC